jgi:hypothetical protein
VSYFRPEQAGKIGPRAIHSFPDSTSLLSQNAGQVTKPRVLTYDWTKNGGQVSGNGGIL